MYITILFSEMGGDHCHTVWVVSYTLLCLFESKIVLLSLLSDSLDSIPMQFADPVIFLLFEQ